MAHYLLEWATILGIFMIGAVTPGADFAVVLRQSIIHGRKNAIMTSFGIGLALLFHVTYTILGLGIIISQSIILFNIIKWAGVFYLTYIGIKALLSKGHAEKDNQGLNDKKSQQSLKKAFFTGFTVNVLNPKAVFFFLSIFSSFVASTTPMTMKFSYGLSMAFGLFLWFTLVSIFMTAPSILAKFYRASKLINRLCGAVFIGFAVKLMFQKAN